MLISQQPYEVDRAEVMVTQSVSWFSGHKTRRLQVNILATTLLFRSAGIILTLCPLLGIYHSSPPPLF